MLFRKLWRTIGLYKAQFISMMIMIALGLGVFVGFHMEWVSIRENTNRFYEETGFADERIVSEQGFSADDVQKIAAIPGVRLAARFVSAAADVAGQNGDTVTLTVTENPSVSGFALISGEPYDPSDSDGIWLSDRYAAANGYAAGDPISLIYKDITFSGVVRGLIKSSEYLICVRDETQLMPDFSTHGFAYLSPAFYERAVGFGFYPQIHVLTSLEQKEFDAVVNRALGKTSLILSKNEVISYAGTQGEIEEGQTMGAILPVLFLLIAVLTMVTTMHRIAVREKTQIGTLKALGFKDRRILRHYSSFAFLIGLIGAALGVALGFAVAYWIMNPNGTMGTYFDMPHWHLYLPWFCAVTVAAVVALLTWIGFLSVRQMLRGTPADALRPYTPKNVKPLLLEKTRLFQRFGFGTRWNLRDIMRHKSRTAMTLLGIVGCMMILVCALGMRDTMDSFLDLYYNGALRYASRVYFSEDAAQEARDELIKTYDGDWSASISVQLEDKAVSLDLYGLTHDMVRFPAKNGGYLPLSDDGAYICLRLAEAYDLSPGDTFSVSPYGSDQVYTLKVAGLMRSVSENIVISSAYADALHIPYVADSLYTNLEKTEIAPDHAIKSVQSRQMIMDSFDSFMEIMNTMIFVLVFGAVLLGVVVLYNLGVMSYTERYREMATLKVVGFKDRKIAALLVGQNLWLSAVGILIGLPFGMGVLEYMLKTMASEYELKMTLGPLTYSVSILLTFAVSMVVSLLVARKNRKIDMVEALKCAE